MSDEIKKDGNPEFERLFGAGKLRACPNLTHYDDETKKALAKKAVEYCTELLMKTHISLGISGQAQVTMEEGITGRVFTLTFKSSAPGGA